MVFITTYTLLKIFLKYLYKILLKIFLKDWSLLCPSQKVVTGDHPVNEASPQVTNKRNRIKFCQNLLLNKILNSFLVFI